MLVINQGSGDPQDFGESFSCFIHKHRDMISTQELESKMVGNGNFSSVLITEHSLCTIVPCPKDY